MAGTGNVGVARGRQTLSAGDARSTIGLVGSVLGLGWVVVLLGVLVLNNETARVPPAAAMFLIIVAAVPAVLGSLGVHGDRRAFAVAAVISLPIALWSFSGATLPLIVPGLLYLAATKVNKRYLIVLAMVAGAETMLHLGWPFIDDNDAFPSLQIQISFVTGIGLFLIPHALAWLAQRHRWLLLPAGLLGMALTVMSAISPVLLIGTFPLVFVPSVFYVVRFVRETVR